MKNLKTFYSIVLTFFILAARFGFAQPFEEIIAFGDSLTDVGNVAGLTEPGVSPRINGYFEETHFSDNVIWVETLANYWGLPARTPGRGSSTTLPPEPNGNTWAWGGSEAASGFVQPPGVIEPIPNLLEEISEYLQANTPNPNALYAIWSGADNLLIGGKFGPKEAKKAAATVVIAMAQLQRAGARHFVIFNMPKLGDTPSAQSGGPLAIIAANIYSDSYNEALKSFIKGIRESGFDGNIYYINVYKEIVKAVDIVEAGGIYVPDFFVPGPPVVISNVTDEALSVFNATGTFPINYLFWDDVHPTTQGHQIVAGLVLKSIMQKLNH